VLASRSNKAIAVPELVSELVGLLMKITQCTSWRYENR
jgi:hypothetical protein